MKKSMNPPGLLPGIAPPMVPGPMGGPGGMAPKKAAFGGAAMSEKPSKKKKGFTKGGSRGK